MTKQSGSIGDASSMTQVLALYYKCKANLGLARRYLKLCQQALTVSDPEMRDWRYLRAIRCRLIEDSAGYPDYCCPPDPDRQLEVYLSGKDFCKRSARPG